MTVQLTARNATPQQLVEILQTQKAHKLDLVVPATNMKSADGKIIVKDSEAQLTDTGVLAVNGTYRPTDVFIDGAADKLVIPSKYLHRLHAERPDLFDQNVNGLLHGRKRRVSRQVDGISPGSRTVYEDEQVYPADDRKFLLRLFRGDDGDGVARAMLSDTYGLSMDNLDMLLAVQQGISASGVNVHTRVTNLSEHGMRIRFEAPDIYAEAPGLLDNYRSPFDGSRVKRAGYFDELRQLYGQHHIFSEKEAPLAFIGFELVNNETGGGAYYLYPLIEMVRCTNGWVERREGIRRNHRGGKLDVGEVKPSMETIRKTGELVAAQAKDAVTTWLTRDYLEKLIGKHAEQAQVKIASPSETVPAILGGLGFTAEESQGILDMFILSGQPTAGGVANAVTAYAQTVEDPDRAFEIELRTIDALEAAAGR
jgi:hypothetical protein